MAKSYDAFYVGGEWVRPSAGDIIRAANPATEEVCATVAAGKPADI
jgi:aldehyde dehydrogenase (NAD+)